MWSWDDEGALAKGAYLASSRYVKGEVNQSIVVMSVVWIVGNLG